MNERGARKEARKRWGERGDAVRGRRIGDAHECVVGVVVIGRNQIAFDRKGEGVNWEQAFENANEREMA